MTFVGKILVLLIMALSLVFLGVSTVVFTASTNWKTETEKQKTEVTKLRTQLQDAKTAEAAVQKNFETAKQEHGAATKTYENEIASLKADNKTFQDRITAAQTQLTDAETNARLSLEETKNRVDENNKIRDQLSAVTDQSNKFKIQQTELNTEILTLKRMLDAAERNAKQLRETSYKLVTLLKRAGLPTDIANIAPVEPTPDVEGRVLKVDAANKRIELSLGSNDGLEIGQELYVFRTRPISEYLGKVKVIAADPQQAVGEVIGTTVHGKKIKEGDDVASSIRSR